MSRQRALNILARMLLPEVWGRILLLAVFGVIIVGLLCGMRYYAFLCAMLVPVLLHPTGRWVRKIIVAKCGEDQYANTSAKFKQILQVAVLGLGAFLSFLVIRTTSRYAPYEGFKELDANRDGKLSVEELNSNHILGRESGAAKRFLDCYDRDKDGFLSREEWASR